MVLSTKRNLAAKKSNTWGSDAICHSTDSFVSLWVAGFPPHGTAFPLSENGDTHGGSPAVWQKCPAPVWRLLSWHLWPTILWSRVDTSRRDSLARRGMEAGRFECHIFGCLHSCLAQASLRLSEFFIYVKVTLSITHNCNMVNPVGLGPRFLVSPSECGWVFAAKPCLQKQMTDWKSIKHKPTL